MNSHLGRFLVQADELIQECRTFGASLRTSLEAELDKLNDTVAHTLDSAAKRTAEHAAARFGTQLDAALGARLTELRQKLDDMGRLADRAAAAHADTGAALPAGLPVAGTAVASPVRRAAPRQPGGRALTVLVATANLMLAALLIMMVLDLRRGDAGTDASTDASATATDADAGVAATATAAASDAGIPAVSSASAAAWAELCEPLAERADPAGAHALIAAAAAAACGDRAAAVTANAIAGVRAQPDADEAPGTAPAPDQKPSRGKKARPREPKP